MKVRTKAIAILACAASILGCVDADTNDMRVVHQAADAETVITGRAFAFEIDGKTIPIISCDPGHFRAELKDATMGNREGNFKEFTVTKPSFDTWRVEKYYDNGDLHLKDLFQAFATGVRKMNPSDTGSLVYLDGNGGEHRRIDFFGFVPLHYESISLDSRNSGQAAVEVMEFGVERLEYGNAAGAPDAVTSPGGSCPVVNVAGQLFKLDLIAGAGQDAAANWYSITGGHQILHATDKTTGSDQFSLADGGDVEFAEVEVKGPFAEGGTRAELLEILHNFEADPNYRFNATLELLDELGNVTSTRHYRDSIPTRYTPPTIEPGGTACQEQEVFRFKPGRVEG